jgi:hypothetical protein
MIMENHRYNTQTSITSIVAAYGTMLGQRGLGDVCGNASYVHPGACSFSGNQVPRNRTVALLDSGLGHAPSVVDGAGDSTCYTILRTWRRIRKCGPSGVLRRRSVAQTLSLQDMKRPT